MTDLALVKTFAEFIRGSLRFDAHHKERLGKHLREIANLLGTVKDDLADGIVPRESSYQLASLINFTNETLHGVFKIPNDAELDDIFSKQLPHIGYLLRSADVFIDGQPRDGIHKYMYVLSAREVDYKVSPRSVSLALEEIERAVGRLRAASNFLDPKGGAGESGGKKKSARKPSTSKSSKENFRAKKGAARKVAKGRA